MKNYLLLLGALIIFGSCSTPDATVSSRISGGSSQTLTFTKCRAVSDDEVEFVFSRSVTVKSLTFYPDLSVNSIESGSTVRINLAEKTEPGTLITADILAEDEKKNTINVLISFRARNDRMPDLVINELCTEYASVTAGRKAEFIEFKMKSDGNLGAMRVFIIGNSAAAKETIYEFSPVEVKKGDYIVLHLRTYDAASKDEYGSNLNASGGLNSSGARDFWIPGTSKLFHKTSMVYVLDQDDKVLNAAIISENPDPWWTKDYFAETAAFLFAHNAWKASDGQPPGPADAFISAGTTNTRTICRDETVENSNSAADWYITATSSATPGGTNNTKRYLN